MSRAASNGRYDDHGRPGPGRLLVEPHPDAAAHHRAAGAAPADAAAAEGDVTAAIDPDAFATARAAYYRLRGWSPEGRWQPDAAVLETLQSG